MEIEIATGVPSAFKNCEFLQFGALGSTVRSRVHWKFFAHARGPIYHGHKIPQLEKLSISLTISNALCLPRACSITRVALGMGLTL